LLILVIIGQLQDFWHYYNNLPSPMQLRPGNSMHLMKLGVVPLWEDAANVRGGSFSVRVPKHQTAKAWLYILLAAIGEQFSSTLAASGDDDVCGVSVSVRRGGDNVLTFWNQDARAFDLSSFHERVMQLVPNAELSHPSYKRTTRLHFALFLASY
jgi:translation initiation factor 4E